MGKTFLESLAEQAAEKRGYDRCIADVAAWLRSEGQQCADSIRTVLRTAAFCIEKGQARGFVEKAKEQPKPGQEGPR